MKTLLFLLAILFANLWASAQFTVTQMTNPDTKNHDLYCSFSLNKDYGFAAGSGTFLKRSNDVWSKVDLGGLGPQFISVWASTSNSIKLVATSNSRGAVYHSDGQTIILDTILPVNLACAKFFSANDYFVGGQGYLFHYKDGIWSSFALSSSAYEIVGIEGTSSDDLLLFINISSTESKIATFKNSVITGVASLSDYLYSTRQFKDKYYLCGEKVFYSYNEKDNSVKVIGNFGSGSAYVLDSNSIIACNSLLGIFHFNGSESSVILAVPSWANSFSSSADDPNHIYAVGAGGQIFKITNTSIGINEAPEITPEINIYPNPAKDFVNIDLGSQRTKTLISIFDYSGKLVLRDETDQALTKLDVSSLDYGLYFVRGETAKSSFTKKLVISR